MTERLVPFYCPYCGEESLEPVGGHGEWHCRDCTRHFTLRSGVGRQVPADPAGTALQTAPPTALTGGTS